MTANTDRSAESGVVGASVANRTTLFRDLRALGVVEGDRLFVHSSYKILGQVDGGAETVIGALEDAVGQEGLLAMPSFHLIQRDLRAALWDPAATPSTVGWITEVFRCMPGTTRSDHYSHSVAARGAGAETLGADHRRREGLSSPWDEEPWGATYGTHSPMWRLYQSEARLLMLGVDYESSTYVHLVEVLLWHQLRIEDAGRPFIGLTRAKMGAFWDEQGRLSRGRVGDADCRLFGIRDYVNCLLDEARANLDEYGRG